MAPSARLDFRAACLRGEVRVNRTVNLVNLVNLTFGALRLPKSRGPNHPRSNLQRQRDPKRLQVDRATEPPRLNPQPPAPDPRPAPHGGGLLGQDETRTSRQRQNFANCEHFPASMRRVAGNWLILSHFIVAVAGARPLSIRGEWHSTSVPRSIKRDDQPDRALEKADRMSAFGKTPHFRCKPLPFLNLSSPWGTLFSQL